MLRSTSLWYLVIIFFAFDSNAMAKDVTSNNSMFDVRFLNASSEHMDFFKLEKRFIYGSYNVDLYINDQYIGNKHLFIDMFEYNDSELCLEKDFLKNIDLSFYSDVKHGNEDCYFLNRETFTIVDFNSEKLTLNLSIPQIYFNRNNQDSMKWNSGITTLRSNYFVNISDSNTSDIYYSGDIDLGANWDRWSWESRLIFNQKNIGLNQAKLSTPLVGIKSDLIIGQSWTKSYVYDNFAFSGVQLASNSSMNPIETRGYAPTIVGVVHENSTIFIIQSGIVVHQERLAPGPYLIDDIRPVSNGEITVVIEGDSGKKSIERMSMSVLPNMKRAGDFEYDLSAGYKTIRVSELFDRTSDNDLFISFNSSYGLEKYTLIGSSIVSKNYYLLGGQIIQSLDSLGTIGLSLSRSSSRPGNYDWKHGYSFKLNYSKNINSNTDFNFISYHYRDRNYNDFVNYDLQLSNRNRREKYDARLSTRFQGISLAASYWNEIMWDKSKYSGLSLMGSFQFDSSSISLNSNYINDKNFNLSLSVNIPINFTKGDSISIASSYNESGEIINSLSSNHQVSDSLSITNSIDSNHDRRLFTVSGSYKTNKANYNASVSAGSDGRYQAKSSISGSLLYTDASGLVSSSNISETIAIVEIENQKNIDINGERTNEDGIAIVSLQPYRNNMLDINVNSLPNEIELKNTMLILSPKQKSVLYESLDYDFIRTFNIYIPSLESFSGDYKILDKYNNNVGYYYNGIVIASVKSDSDFIQLESEKRIKCTISLKDISPNTDSIYERDCQ